MNIHASVGTLQQSETWRERKCLFHIPAQLVLTLGFFASRFTQFGKLSGEKRFAFQVNGCCIQTEAMVLMVLVEFETEQLLMNEGCPPHQVNESFMGRRDARKFQRCGDARYNVQYYPYYLR